MFYAISKRRRDINAAEERGREEGRAAVLDAIANRISADPGVDLRTIVAELDAIAKRIDNDPNVDTRFIITELRAKSRSENGRPE